MAKKRGLASNRGLDALLSSIKKETQIVASVSHGEAEITRAKNLPQEIPSHLPDSPSSPITLQTELDFSPELSKLDETKPDLTPNSTQNLGKKLADPHTKDKLSDIHDISLIQIKVNQLQSGKYQPRRDMNEEALQELSASIRQHGVMQPIIIRPLLAQEDKTAPEVTHEIIAGERRWRAAKMAGVEEIPAIERALSDEMAIALALIENIQREDLSVIEQAAALQRFHTEFGMSHTMIADVVGKARTTVSNLLRLNQLHDEVKEFLAEGLIDMGHARPLLSLSYEQQPIIAKNIIEGNLTARETEKLVKSILNPAPSPKANPIAHEIERLNQQLSDALGATVKIKPKKDGKGSMEIFFYSEEEMMALIDQLKK